MNWEAVIESLDCNTELLEKTMIERGSSIPIRTASMVLLAISDALKAGVAKDKEDHAWGETLAMPKMDVTTLKFNRKGASDDHGST